GQRPAGADRGRDRPRGPAAAASHHVRAGQEDAHGAQGRREPRADRARGGQGQAARVHHAMSATAATRTDVAVDGLDVSAYEIPTDGPDGREADGTLEG